MSSFWSRIVIAAAGIPLVLWILYLGGWPLFGLALVAALFALHELYWMTRALRPVVLAGYLGAIGTLLGAELGGADWALAGLFVTLAFAFVFKGSVSSASVGVTVLGVVWIAFDYGGRAELADAARGMIEAGVRPDEVSEDVFAVYLYAPDMPDPDLVIRTSGELRMSNFLLWQLAYSEFFFADTLWPDFGEDDLREAVAAYAGRQRRFGRR